MNEYRRAMMALPSVESESCAFCGRPATNRHHVVPRGQGGSDGPTVCVCGMGNASGCHGLLHAQRLHMRPDGNGWWEWLLTMEPTKHDKALGMPGWHPLGRR